MSIAVSSMIPYTSQKTMFKYGISPGSTALTVTNALTKFILNNKLMEVNMPAGYGLQGDGSVRIPYTGFWIFTHRICCSINASYAVNQRGGFDTNIPNITSIYSNASNYYNMNDVYLGLRNHGAGGEYSNVMFAHARKNDLVWISTLQNGGTYDTTRTFFSGIYLGP